MATHHGGCHCGQVTFTIEAPSELVVYECNCSMCGMSGFQHLIIPKAAFTLLSGELELSSYSFNTGEATHLFCRRCGIKSFYVPRSNPDGYSVNGRCLDPSTIETLTTAPFDGQDWEANAEELRHLTQK